MDTNLWIIGGRLTRDPKSISREGSDKTMVALDIAHNSRRKVGGEWKDKTMYLQATVFGNMADNCLQYLKKGSHVQVIGECGFKEWEYEGKTKFSPTVFVQQIQFLDKKPKAEEEAPF